MTTAFRQATAAAVLAAALLAAAPALAGDARAYAVVQNGDFGVLDLATGAFTFRGNAGIGQVAGLGAGAGGTLYGVTTHGHQLYRIDPATGGATAVGAAVAVDYLAFGSTTTALYGYGYDRILYRIDAATGAATALGATGVPTTGYFGFSAGSATLYEVHDAELYAIDQADGAATALGQSASGRFGAAVSVGGVLYAASDLPQAVYTLDPATGAGTAVAPISGTTQIVYGLAPGVPEPAAWTLLLAGFAVVGTALRRRPRASIAG